MKRQNSHLVGSAYIIVVVRFWPSSGSRHVSHFIRIILSGTASPGTFLRPLQPGSRRKPECLPEIILAQVIHLYEKFDESTLRVGSANPHNAGPLRNLSPPLLDKAQQRDSAICEGTLPDHSHVSNIIIPPIQRMSLWMEAEISACQSQ